MKEKDKEKDNDNVIKFEKKKNENLIENEPSEIEDQEYQFKFKISRDNISYALQKLLPITERRAAMPILSSVLIETLNHNSLKLSATDLYISYSIIIPAVIEKEGAICLNAKTLSDITRLLPVDETEFIVDRNWWTEIKCGKTKYKIPGILSDDFPTITEVGEEEYFPLTANIVNKLASMVAFSMCPDDNRPMIHGALLEGEGKILRMVSTDGHRLTKAQTRIEEGGGLVNISALIPFKGVHQLRRFLEGDNNLKVSLTDRFVYFKISTNDNEINQEELLAIKLVEESFPPYSPIIPPEGEKFMIINRDNFIAALKRLALVTTDRSLGVKILISNDKMILKCESPELGEAQEEVDVNYSGNEMNQVLNHKYILDVLTVINNDNIKVELNNQLDPWIITTPDGREEFVAVIMPMKY